MRLYTSHTPLFPTKTTNKKIWLEKRVKGRLKGFAAGLSAVRGRRRLMSELVLRGAACPLALLPSKPSPCG